MSITPMMQQYLDIKGQYQDCILLFRLGDFYEMFFEDAKISSKDLEITLTGKDCGLDEKAPMCGVPHHSAEGYITRLIEKGHKVAICEQVEDAQASKGIVKRDVVRVITPGTIMEASMLDEKKNNYLMTVCKESYCFGIGIADVTTGEFYATNILYGNTKNKLFDEIAKYYPSEIIVNSAVAEDETLLNEINSKFNVYITFENDLFKRDEAIEKIRKYFKKEQIKNDSYNYAINAAGALIAYLEKTQKVNLEHIKSIKEYKVEEYMIIDYASRKNLELTETLREKNRKGSLLWVLDKTATSMGARMLRKWIEQPLINIDDIRTRLNAVFEMKEKFMIRSEIRELLKNIYDIERLTGKLILGNVNCRDLISLRNSIGHLPSIKGLLADCTAELNITNKNSTDTLDDIFHLIDKAVEEEPPIAIKEGNIIKTGYNAEVDELRKASKEGKNWISEFETRERARTGIKNLKVRFNRIFGYFIEITKSNYSLVPDDYVRRQTLANAERFITNDLKEIEETILGAEEKVLKLEYEIFVKIRDGITSQISRVKSTAKSIAEIDVICALAEVADRENYVCPDVDCSGEINIKNGRHPVVEKVIPEGNFVPNDVYLDRVKNRLAIITGPNMAGKSTYMRQVALITLMAQIGSFVPADRAKIGVADRIFTRVGASDDLASGQSTFLVEMSEVANILQNATQNSLLILDEIGRGTSTFDGLSIAWAVVEYIADAEKIGARTLFATHYHELTELERENNGIKNYCILVQEDGEDIIFLRKIGRGGADDSYGIQVAKIAGVPEQVICRANEILEQLEANDLTKKEVKGKGRKKSIEGQLDLFCLNSDSDVLHKKVYEEIKSVNVEELTPLQALNFVHQLKQKIKNG